MTALNAFRQVLNRPLNQSRIPALGSSNFRPWRRPADEVGLVQRRVLRPSPSVPKAKVGIELPLSVSTLTMA